MEVKALNLKRKAHYISNTLTAQRYCLQAPSITPSYADK